MSDFLTLASHRLHYKIEGAENAPVILFCNSLGTNLHMWDEQIASLTNTFRVVRYDRRGHGQSTASSVPFTIEDLGKDVLALIEHLALGKVHFCGLSIGGLVGQWLGINASHKLHSLTICASAAKIGTAEAWLERAKMVREQGLSPLLEGTEQRWFTPEFTQKNPQVKTAILNEFLETSAEGYAQCCEALATADFNADLFKIKVPTLCIYGDDDPVCPASDLIHIARNVQKGQDLGIPGRHIFNLESAEQFNTALTSFINSYAQNLY